ncbi:MAG: lysylphosphatidylglycerol synthase transmembrane domain-containing protein [Steroidobacteraceae bacterium]
MSRIVRILISIVLLALVIGFADWQAVWKVLREVDLRWVGVVWLIAVADRMITNYRWQILLVGRGVFVGFGRLFKVQLAANFIGAFLPGFIGVDAVRITALCRSGESAAPVFAATLVDRVTLAIGTLMVGAVTVIFLARERVPHGIIRFVLVLTLVAMIVMAFGMLPAVRNLMRWKILPLIPERLRHRVAEIAAASLAYRHQWRLGIEVAAVTILLFALRIVFAKAVALSCDVNVSWLDLMLVIPILWVVVMLPITVGGIGVQDAGYVVLMGLVGVAAPVAVSMSLVEHLVARLASLPGVLFFGEVTGRTVSTDIQRDT